MKKKAVVFPAAGIGDALLMMIASARLLELGYEVTTLHPALLQLQEWFPKQKFSTAPPLEQFATFFSSCDLIIVENDNSTKVRSLVQLREEKKIEHLAILYPTYEPHKHAPLNPLDKVFNPKLPMAANIAEATAKLLLLSSTSKDNNILPPADLLYRRHMKRIIFHPTSSALKKNWTREKYFIVADKLQKKGFEPIFAVSSHERPKWLESEKRGFPFPNFESLDLLARFVYESGFVIGNDSLLGHLASNLHIPTLIIADNAQRMLLWQPDWLQGRVITPPRWIPNCKGLRWRERYWQKRISPRQVLAAFDQLSRAL